LQKSNDSCFNEVQRQVCNQCGDVHECSSILMQQSRSTDPSVLTEKRTGNEPTAYLKTRTGSVTSQHRYAHVYLNIQVFSLPNVKHVLS
jgi:hypothetical protein